MVGFFDPESTALAVLLPCGVGIFAGDRGSCELEDDLTVIRGGKLFQREDIFLLG